MQYLTGKDYAYLCQTCRAAIDSTADIVCARADCGSDDDLYASDLEGPLNLACDLGIMCGGRYCAAKVSTETEGETIC